MAQLVLLSPNVGIELLVSCRAVILGERNEGQRDRHHQPGFCEVAFALSIVPQCHLLPHIGNSLLNFLVIVFTWSVKFQGVVGDSHAEAFPFVIYMWAL